MYGEKQKLKQSRGITLIALVITIVILIILATIAIQFTFGENGLIGRTEDARKYYTNDTQYTGESLTNVESYINGILGENVDDSENNGGDTVQSGIWTLQKSTNEYSGYIQLKLTSQYFQEKPLTLNEYKEKYIVKIMNEESGTSYNTLDEYIITGLGGEEMFSSI